MVLVLLCRYGVEALVARRSVAGRRAVLLHALPAPSGLDLAAPLNFQAQAFLLCLQASSKTSVAVSDDPTAGMSPEEITNYVSKVGGGMCNAPEPVRAAVGLALNLSLIVFGLFTVSYVVLGGLNFALEKQVEELVEGVTGDKPGKKTFSDMASDAWNAPINIKPPPGSPDSDAPSREQRRLAARVKKGSDRK